MARAAPGRASCRCGDERHAVWPFAGNRKSQTSPRRQEAGRLLPGARRAGRASRKGLGASGDRPCRVPVEVTQAERSSRNSLRSLPFTVCQSHLGRLICSGCRVGAQACIPQSSPLNAMGLSKAIRVTPCLLEVGVLRDGGKIPFPWM